MKKILLGSAAALVASAGVAAADVTLSGDGRIGVVYNSADASSQRFSFNSRARVTFTLSGETDTGMAFGGSFRADNAVGASGGTAGSAFISGDFGRLTAGDTAGAAQFIVGHVGGVGLTGLGDLNESLFLGNRTDNQTVVTPAVPATPPTLIRDAAGNVTGIAPGTAAVPAVTSNVQRPTFRYDINIDGFSVALSHTNPASRDRVAAIAAGYSFDGISVGLGYENWNRQNAANIQHAIIGAGFSMDGISVRANFGRVSAAAGTASRDQYSVSASGSFDEVGVTAYYARNFGRATSFGIGGSYDLGGGASLVGGIVRTNAGANALAPRNANSRTLADFGVSMSF